MYELKDKNRDKTISPCLWPPWSGLSLNSTHGEDEVKVKGHTRITNPAGLKHKKGSVSHWHAPG